MPAVFVDTSVLIAAENTADPAHGACLQWLDSLWKSRNGRTGMQSLLEFYEQATTCPASPLAQGDARAAIRRYHSWTPWKTDAATLETAWALQARHRLAWGDCLALACAQHSGCAFMLSFALPHAAQLGGVQVLHPALQAPPEEPS